MVAMVLAALIGWTAPSFGQLPCPPAPPPYQSLRYQEDYAFLRNPDCRTDLWDPVKYISLADREDVYVSLGGEVRLQYEYFRNADWGEGPQDPNGYLLPRLMLHTEWQLGPYVGLFGQLKSGLAVGRTGGPRPPDEDQLDLHQAFLDVRGLLGEASALTLRAGRQELAYGASRLVDPREGPNVRRSFDGLRTILGAGGWSVEAFATRPVETNRYVFDDSTDAAVAFWGVYSVSPRLGRGLGNLDFYYLGLDRTQAPFDQGTNHETRHSVGVRWWGRDGAWDYDVEATYQWGSFGPGAIQAWALASDFGVRLDTVTWQPRLGLRADIASGDRDPAKPTLQTFNALFPKGRYFGGMALIGLPNIVDLHPSVAFRVTEEVSVELDWDVFWRQSVHDGIYGPPGNLLRSAEHSRARYVGSQPGVTLEWQVDRHLTLTLEYGHFFAGPFLQETESGRDIDWSAATLTYKF
jgi:hypothetical protein